MNKNKELVLLILFSMGIAFLLGWYVLLTLDFSHIYFDLWPNKSELIND